MDTLRGKFGLSAWDEESLEDSGADDFGLEDTDENQEIETPPSPVGQDERRMQVRAYNFWAGMLQDRSLPCIEDLEPETQSDFGPFSVLLDFTSGIENPAVPFIGESLAGECDAAGEIETLADVPSRSLLSRITDHYMQILANKAPIGFEAEFVNQRGSTVLYRGILLPFSSDDDTIDFIYGVINWKEVADQITTDALLLEIDNALEEASEQEGGRVHADDPIADWADGPGMEVSGDIDADLSRPAETDMPMPELDSSDLDASDLDDSGLPMPGFGMGTDEFADEPEDQSASMSARLLSGGESADDDDGEDNPDDWSTPLSSLIKPKTERPKKLALGSLLHGHDDDHTEQEESYDASGDDVAADFGEDASAPIPMPVGFGDEDFADEGSVEVSADVSIESTDDVPAPLDLDAFETVAPESGESQAADESLGLYDCLAAARELAQAARHSEDRSRNALYAAVSRAYDVSLAAEEAPEDFEELVSENGLTVQERAPMTPVVKLVFGADYDKTRLTEYAAVLSHAHRLELERGALSEYLTSADGGLKGVVQAERRLRREEAGKPVAAPGDMRESLAKKLRALDTSALDNISSDGAEFGVVMIRRLPTGEVVLVGEVEDDMKLTEQVGRKLVG